MRVRAEAELSCLALISLLFTMKAFLMLRKLCFCARQRTHAFLGPVSYDCAAKDKSGKCGNPYARRSFFVHVRVQADGHFLEVKGSVRE